jgi:hypothetical protein
MSNKRLEHVLDTVTYHAQSIAEHYVKRGDFIEGGCGIMADPYAADIDEPPSVFVKYRIHGTAPSRCGCGRKYSEGPVNDRCEVWDGDGWRSVGNRCGEAAS